MRLIFDITNLIALILISVGVGIRFGWDISAIIGGALLMVVNFRVASMMTRAD